MKVQFIAGFGPVVPDMNASRTFYADALGLPLEGDASYLSTAEIAGAPSDEAIRAPNHRSAIRCAKHRT